LSQQSACPQQQQQRHEVDGCPRAGAAASAYPRVLRFNVDPVTWAAAARRAAASPPPSAYPRDLPPAGLAWQPHGACASARATPGGLASGAATERSGTPLRSGAMSVTPPVPPMGSHALHGNTYHNYPSSVTARRSIPFPESARKATTSENGSEASGIVLNL
jgi:hypothetical protein